MCFDKEFAEMVIEQKQLLTMIHPLMSGAEFSFLERRPRWLNEYNFLLREQEKNEWKDLPPLLEALHNPETAIILTDLQENIQWVNLGFSRMSGYSSSEVLGKNPRFLQGAETCKKQKKEIRQAISQKEVTTSIIRNYRKSGEAYDCKITIYPLFNQQEQVVHFVAIENEVSLQPG